MEADAFDLAGLLHRRRRARRAHRRHRRSRAGDAIVGLASSGLHANGFSLVRALLAEWDLDLAEPYQARLRRTLGDAATDAALAAAPHEALATLGEVLLTPTRIYARASSRCAQALVARGRDLHGLAHVTGGGLPGQRAARAARGPGGAPRPGALGDALGDAPVRGARRAGRRGAARDVQRRPRDGRGRAARRPVRRPSASLRGARARGDARRRGRRGRGLGGARYVEGPLRGRVAGERPDRRRRLRRRLEPAGAARRRRDRGELGGEIVLVSPTGRARRSTGRRSRGSTPRWSPGGDDDDASPTPWPAPARRRRARRLHADRRAARRSRRSPAGSSTRIPSLLPAFPGAHAVARRARARRRGHRRARSTSSTRRSTAARSSPRRRSRSCPTTTRRRSTRGSRPSSTGCCRAPSRCCSPAAIADDGRHVTHRPRPGRRARADAAPRAPVGLGQDRPGRVRPRPGRARLRARLDRRHGAGAARGRPAGHRRRRRHRLPGDARRPGQDAPPARPRRAPRRPPAGRPSRASCSAAAIAPFELVVVNLYPFAAAAERPGITLDELIEEIDIGGPSLVRAAAKNHANVAIVTSPARYDAVLAALDATGGSRRRLAARRWRSRRSATRRPTTPGSPRSCPAGWPTPASPPDEPGLPATIRTRRRLTVALEKVETLRYGENPHQPAARYRRPGSDARPTGPFATGGRRSRARRSRTTTCSTRRRRRRSGGPCAARRA